jgi:transposase
VRKRVAGDLARVDRLDGLIGARERFLVRTAQVEDPQAYHRLQTIPGVGKVLALILLYEVHDVGRLPDEGAFLSSARRVRCPHAAAGKRVGTGGATIGNAHRRGPSPRRCAC